MNIQPLSILEQTGDKVSLANPDGQIVHFILAVQQALVRQSFGYLLRNRWPGILLTPAATLTEASDALTGTPMDILLLDQALAGAGEFGSMRSSLPDLRVIMLVDGNERASVVACLLAGANGVVSKSGTFAELERAIEMARAGHVHVPDFMSQVLPDSAPSHPTVPVTFTGRQQDVLRLLATGQSTKDMARSLDLAVSTIKVHLAAVYRALGARNRIDALRRAGILPGYGAAHA